MRKSRMSNIFSGGLFEIQSKLKEIFSNPSNTKFNTVAAKINGN